MHQLHHDFATFGMDGLCHLCPTVDLLLRVNARRAPIALAFGRGLHAFGDDQPGAGALAVIFDHQVGRHIAWPRTITGHRCHDDAIGALQRAEGDRSE